MADKDALKLIFTRNLFYRRLYHLALATFVLSLVVIGLLGGMLYYVATHPPKPVYFATDPMSRLVRVIPLSSPNMPLADVEKWAIEAVEAAYSYNYINYRAELQNAQKYFTTYGWGNYMKALTASRNLVALTNRKMIISARVIRKPKLLRQGILAGAYAYRFTMPMLVTYSLPPYDGSNKSRFSNALEINVLVQRQYILQSYKGLGIIQIVGATARNPVANQTISNTPQ